MCEEKTIKEETIRVEMELTRGEIEHARQHMGKAPIGFLNVTCTCSGCDNVLVKAVKAINGAEQQKTALEEETEEVWKWFMEKHDPSHEISLALLKESINRVSSLSSGRLLLILGEIVHQDQGAIENCISSESIGNLISRTIYRRLINRITESAKEKTSI